MTSTAPGRIAALDFGTVRVGIAISDPQRTFASPYENYNRRNREQDARRFRQLATDEQVVLFLVGLPIHLDGHESQKSIEARRFGQWLEQETGVPVQYWDERFTSAEAEEMLMAAQLTKRQRKKRMDMLAAQILLANFLASGCPTGPQRNHPMT